MTRGIMRNSGFGVSVAALGCLFAMPAHAGKYMNYVQVTVTPQLMLERARNQNIAVRDAVGRALVEAPRETAVPLPYLGMTRYYSDDVLGTSNSAFGITGTSETGGTASASKKWNIWINGTYTYLDDNLPMAGYDGYQSAGIAGIDYKITDRIVLGLIGNLSTSDIDNTVPFTGIGNSQTDGYGLGAYAGVLVTDHIVADASFLYNWTDNSTFDGVDTASYNSDGWTLGGNLTGYWYTGKWRWSPAIGISWSHNHDDAYVDSASIPFPAQEQDTGLFTFGGTAGYNFAVSDKNTAELWASATGEWTFERSGSPSLTTPGVPVRNDDFDVRLASGLDITTASGITLGVSGEVSGIAISDYISYGGKVSLAVPF